MLSTHFLEEADALADEIVILVNGQIREKDSPARLKRKYGIGYKLIINKTEEEELDLFQLIENRFCDCWNEIETKNQLIIGTSDQSSKYLIELLRYLDELKERKVLGNYSLSNPTLGLKDLIEKTNFIERDCRRSISSYCH